MSEPIIKKANLVDEIEAAHSIPERVERPTLDENGEPSTEVVNIYSWRFVGSQPIRDLNVVDVACMRINSDELPLLWNHGYNDIIGKVFDFEKREDGLYGKVEFAVIDPLGAKYERLVRGKYLRTVSVGIMCFPEDVEMLEPENEDHWFWGMYFGPEKWNNPELLEVSMTPVPRDITAQRQIENAIASRDERIRAAAELEAKHERWWRNALRLPPSPTA